MMPRHPLSTSEAVGVEVYAFFCGFGPGEHIGTRTHSRVYVSSSADRCRTAGTSAYQSRLVRGAPRAVRVSSVVCQACRAEACVLRQVLGPVSAPHPPILGRIWFCGRLQAATVSRAGRQTHREDRGIGPRGFKTHTHTHCPAAVQGWCSTLQPTAPTK